MKADPAKLQGYIERNIEPNGDGCRLANAQQLSKPTVSVRANLAASKFDINVADIYLFHNSCGNHNCAEIDHIELTEVVPPNCLTCGDPAIVRAECRRHYEERREPEEVLVTCEAEDCWTLPKFGDLCWNHYRIIVNLQVESIQDLPAGASQAIKVSGEVAEIPLIAGGTAVIDAEDLGLALGYWWRTHYGYKSNELMSVIALKNSKNASSRRYVVLDRLITGAEFGSQVIHLNGDPLDCRKVNLEVFTYDRTELN